MSFHLDYLLYLPGVKVETCTQIEGHIYFRLSALASEIVCPHCNNYTEELHQNRPILARDLSGFRSLCVFTSTSSAVLLR
jgi:hypothetical protein